MYGHAQAETIRSLNVRIRRLRGKSLQNLQKPEHLLLGVKSSQANADETAGTLFIVTHGEQYARGLPGMMGVAGAACRDGDTGAIESCKQCADFALLTAKSETQVTRQTLRRMTE